MSSVHYLRARAIRFRGLAHRARNPDDARYLLELATYADLQAEALEAAPGALREDTNTDLHPIARDLATG